MSRDAAWIAFDQARELFYAAVLAGRATSEPLNYVPLLRRSVLLLLQALAASDGVSSDDRGRIMAAAAELDRRERVLRFPLLEELPLLDALERRFADLSAKASADEARQIERLVDAMPQVLAAVRRRLVTRGLSTNELSRRRRRYRLLAVAGMVLGLALLGVFGTKIVKSGPVLVSRKGIHGSYFAGTEFTRLIFERWDDRIDFDWGIDAPNLAVPADGFSVRWDGKLKVPASDRYTFYIASDDGSRLYVDDRLVIDNWGNHVVIERDATVDLQAGVVPIRVDYFDNAGAATIRLSWSSGGRSKRIIENDDWAR